MSTYEYLKGKVEYLNTTIMRKGMMGIPYIAQRVFRRDKITKEISVFKTTYVEAPTEPITISEMNALLSKYESRLTDSRVSLVTRTDYDLYDCSISKELAEFRVTGWDISLTDNEIEATKEKDFNYLLDEGIDEISLFHK